MATQKRVFVTTPRRPLASAPARKPVVTPRFPLPSAAPSAAFSVVSRMAPGLRGLAIGWGLPEGVTLPGWALVLSRGPAKLPDLSGARRAAGAHAEVPLLLIGDGSGVQTAFSAFIANQTITVCGAAFFGAKFPTDDYSVSLWVHLAERSKEKNGLRLLIDLQGADKTLSAILGSAQAPADGPEGETPAGRVNRLLVTTFGPKSPAMPRPVPPVEHLKAE